MMDLADLRADSPLDTIALGIGQFLQFAANFD